MKISEVKMKTQKNVLVLGGSGLIGQAVVKELSRANQYRVFGTYLTHKGTLIDSDNFKYEVGNEVRLAQLLTAIKPDFVISCLRGDFDKQLQAHRQVSDYLKENKGRLIYFSTLNVFDGDITKPHDENEEPISKSEYGQFKIKCENLITEILADQACILRVPMIWGKESPRLSQLKAALLANEKIETYANLRINTYTDKMLAEAVAFILEQPMRGIFHLGCTSAMNHKLFYEELIQAIAPEQGEILWDEKTEEGIQALSSVRRQEFPNYFKIKNKDVIKYLVGEI